MAQLFNACEYLLDRRLDAGDAPRIALTGGAGDLSYAGLHDQVCRTAAGLRSLGLQPEQRVLMLMADSPQFVVVYLAAMRIGAIFCGSCNGAIGTRASSSSSSCGLTRAGRE